MPPVAHWDEVEPRRRERGHLAGSWSDLGSAAGSVRVGLQRVQVDPGMWSTPAHAHGAEEEIFFVLAGSGISYQQAPDEEGVAYAVGAGDCLVHLALEEAHTLRAGPEGLEVLAFGMRSYAGAVTHMPRSGVARVADTWVLTGTQEDHPWKREAAIGEPVVGELRERPPTIVNLADVEEVRYAGETVTGAYRDLGRAAGSLQSGLKYMVAEPGMLVAPPHCHSVEEEIHVVLDGEGTLVLGDEEHQVRRGSVVSRPAGTKIPHAIRAGAEPLAYVAYGTRDPSDVTYYPRSGKIAFRGVGVIGRLEPLDYWDGER